MNPTNQQIADQLRAHAAALAKGGANLYRVRAFRQAAVAVLGLLRPVTDVLAERGRAGLTDVPGIGDSLAETIDEFVTAGRWATRTRVPQMAG
ncbi:MAG: helix-hairpin-helix domain-containing protein [Fimbriiglobus sp.]